MPYPANIRWSDSFPGVQDGFWAASDLGNVYVDPGINNFGAQAYADVDDHGAGALRVTLKRGTRVGALGNDVDFSLLVAGSSAATATWDADDGLLAVSVATTVNLAAIKAAIDGVTGTPFTTEYVGGATANDALNAGGHEYPFGNGTGDGYARFEILPKDDARVIVGKVKPGNNATPYLFLPGGVPFRGTVDLGHSVWIKADAGNNKDATARWWHEER